MLKKYIIITLSMLLMVNFSKPVKCENFNDEWLLKASVVDAFQKCGLPQSFADGLDDKVSEDKMVTILEHRDGMLAKEVESRQDGKRAHYGLEALFCVYKNLSSKSSYARRIIENMEEDGKLYYDELSDGTNGIGFFKYLTDSVSSHKELIDQVELLECVVEMHDKKPSNVHFVKCLKDSLIQNSHLSFQDRDQCLEQSSKLGKVSSAMIKASGFIVLASEKIA